MSFLMPPRRVQWLIRWGLWMVPAGVLLAAIAAARLKHMGVVTGSVLVLFGISTPTYRRWLQDRGLWMLATFMLIVWLGLYGCFQIDAFRQQLKAPNPRRVRLAIDTGFAMLVVWQQVRFLATIIWVNKAISNTVLPALSLGENHDGPESLTT